ncbi:MAG: hypothetical protein GY953_49490 [bacterium]|nr:hypothetical protein [bacterium]
MLVFPSYSPRLDAVVEPKRCAPAFGVEFLTVRETSRSIPPGEPSEVAPLGSEEPDFEGAPEQYPLYFQPYLSLQYGDGSSANLPWLQELPDPASSALWGLPVEIDPQTADKMRVSNGDRVRLVTPAGALEAAAYVHPAAIPGVVSLAVGQGHREYGRYASGRGVNPLAVVAPLKETHTGVPAFGSTRCRLEKAEGSGGLLQFSTIDRERDLGRR